MLLSIVEGNAHRRFHFPAYITEFLFCNILKRHGVGGMKRVCVLCETWRSGGIEAFLSNVIRSMDRTGLEIDVVCAKLGRSVFTAPLEELGVHFRQLSGSTRKVGENRREFQKLLEERRYDVVYLNAYQALSLAYLALAREAGVPVRIAHSHNTALRKSLTRPLKLALHRWAKKKYADAMTCRWTCSRAAAEFLFGDAENWQFIPNGIDTERFRFDAEERERVRKELGLEGRSVIGNVGRLCYQKNQEFLLDIFKEVITQRPESVLLLVGEGEDKPRLEEKTKALGLEDNVVFYGATHEVERLYWAMDVFVLPSRFEGLPVTGIEAQAAGLPCFFSDSITEECRIRERTRFLPLMAPAGEWAEEIVKAQILADRTAAAEEAASAGFDVRLVAETVKKAWMG